uniref:Cytochrome P450 n=1 Tax=Arion vulgaris TaxID=1028688 RepID=A0A0B7B9W2_9EUPU
MEIQRLASLIPLSGPRIATRDIDFRGYIIAKDTQIFVNFDSILHDKSLWGDEADVFKPERFIAADGSLLSLETWIPFSLGRRACPGESMAKMELFLFVSNIVQRFKICPADSKTVPPIKGQFGITHTPLPHELRMVLRR